MDNGIGLILLDYEINPQTGEIRISGSGSGNSGGGGSPSPGGSPDDAGCGCAIIAAIATFITSLFWGFGFDLALFFAFIAAVAAFNSMKN